MKRTKNEAVDRMVAIMRECNNVALFDDERAELAEHLMKHDVVEVVRCKDCVNRVEFDTNKFHCELTGYYCGKTGYCSDGVRKVGEEQ